MSDRQAGHNSRPNPYVGPRSFEAGERLYGRERETMDLLDLLIAERIVLLYSPSGAGKTSLIQAALIPELEREGFHVHPPLRVSQGDGTGVGGAGIGNRYAHSLLLALEDTRPATDQLSAQALADFTLDGYLATRDGQPQQGEVFIFDQFEEVLTIDPADVDAKLAFFEQVGALLRNRQRWAIFAMREEFIAGLDPYLRAVPTRFSNRFRLELLAVHAARAAMQEPAHAAGVAFTDPAADRLINDLSLVRIQDPDGVTREIPGTTIEPVQLQVVCRRLWDHLDADDQEIDMDDIAAIGDVNQALRDYLSTTLIAVARRTGVAERSMRDWIEHELITEQGLRGQVLQSTGSSRGLDNRVIDELVDAHLLRAENRRGARWLELAHDRLIDPVRKDNFQWRETNLSPLQRQAALWDQENRPAGLLMHGDELDAAEQWATAHPAVLTPREQDFLAAAHNARRLERRDHRMRAGLVVLTAASVLAALIAILFFAQARRSEQVAEDNLAKAEIAESTAQAEAARADRNALDADSKRREAERQLAIARSRQVAASALNRRDAGDAEVAVLLAATALQEITRTVQAESALRAGLRDLRAETQWQAHREAVYGLDLTADNSLLATRSNDNSAKLWAVDENFAPLSDRALMTMTHGGDVTGLVLRADGQRVATSSRDDTVRIWDVPTRAQVISHTLDADVRALRVAPDGNTLVSRSGSRLQLWDFTTGAEIPTDRPLESVGAALRDVAFSRDGRMLVAGSDDVTLWMWEVPSGRRVRVGGFAGAVDGVGFSPSGQFLFAKSRDNLRLFQVPLITRDGQNLVDTDRIFDSDSAANIAARIGTVTRDIVTQDIDAVMEPVQLPGMDDGSFNAVTFSGNEKLLIVGGSDGSIRIWDLLHPDREPRWLRGHTQQINALHTSPDDRLLLSTSLDDTVRIWQLESGEALAVLSTAPENALSARFTPDGLHLYTTDNSGRVQLWRVDAGDAVGYANVNANPPGPLLVLPGLSGDTILTGGQDGLLESWQPHDGRIGAVAPSDVRLEALAATADGTRVAVGAQDGRISLVAWPAGTISAQWPAHANGVRSLLFLDDGALLASSGGDATIRLWDAVTGTPVGQLTGHTNDVNALALAPDGEILISGSADRTVRRWRWRTGQEVETIQAGMSVLTVAVDPAGATIAAGGFSQRVRVWARNNVSSSMVRSLPHSAFVRALAFAPTGRLISGDERGLVRMWDLTTGEATIMQAHDAGWVRSIGVAADGQLFYSVGDDGIVRAWPLTNEVLLAHACRRLSRGLSPVELDDFAPFLTSGEPCRAVAAPPPVVVSRSQAAPLPFPADTIAGLPRILYFEALAGSVVEAGQEFDLRWALDGATHVELFTNDEGRGKTGVAQEDFVINEPTTFRLFVKNGDLVREAVLEVVILPDEE